MEIRNKGMTYTADEASLDTWKPSQEADGAEGILQWEEVVCLVGN